MTHHDHKTDTPGRRFLAALGGTAMLTLWPDLSIAASGGHTRMVVVLLRDAMDGLHLLRRATTRIICAHAARSRCVMHWRWTAVLAYIRR